MTNDNTENVPDQEQIALFDMDNTLCDYVGMMQKDLDALQGPDEAPYIVKWDGNTPEHIKRRMDLIKSQNGWWEGLEVFYLGMSVLMWAKQIGFTTHVLTKGPYKTDSAWSEKRRWCKANLPAETMLTITEDKGLTYGKILVDDYPPYIERWLKWRPRGLVIMPAHPYNESFKHPNVIRYDGINFNQVIKAMKTVFDRGPQEDLSLELD